MESSGQFRHDSRALEKKKTTEETLVKARKSSTRNVGNHFTMNEPHLKQNGSGANHELC